MRPIHCSELRNVLIESSPITDAPGHTRQCASVEFVRREPLSEGESVSVCFGVSEFSLAELRGMPQLLDCASGASGASEFRYRLRGTMRPHRSSS